jgi:NitT/TauT family transport system substrate-binding protein
MKHTFQHLQEANMMKTRAYPRVLWTLLVVALSSVLLPACNALQSGTDQVSVQLKWVHQVQFAGMYVAQQEGYYAKENLDVSLVPFDFGRPDVIGQVLSGQYQFGITGPEDLIGARSEGKPVRAVAVLFRISPDIFLVEPSSGIRSPTDFAGKKIALAPGGISVIYAAMMEQLGLDRSDVQEELVSTSDLWECWEIAPVCANYATNGPIQLRMAGENYGVIWPGDYGVDWYGDVLFTTDAIIEEKPDMVERFVRATLKGWETALGDPDLAVSDTLRYDAKLDETFQRQAMLATVPLVDTGDGPVGLMDAQVWRATQDTLLKQGLLASPLDLDNVFTNRFVEKAH